MKRFIVAASFAALAVPAFAAEVGLPYYQYQINGTLPNVSKSVAGTKAPHADRGNAADGSVASPWANDYRFTAPAQ